MQDISFGNINQVNQSGEKMDLCDKEYLEHEVQIRVLKEISDAKFLATESKFTLMQKNSDDKFHAMEKRIDDRFAHVDYKFNIIIGIGIAALLIPLLKSALGIL